MSSNIDEMRAKVQAFRSDVEETKASVFELNRLIVRYFSLARRWGLPEPIMDAVGRLMQLRVAIMITYRSLMLLFAASGPVGWATGAAGLAAGGLMLYDQFLIERPSY